MRKNLTGKVVLIIAVLMVFLGFIIGVPKSFKPEDIKKSIADQIHLGLDLKGGTYLVLQVMVNDAVNAETDRTLARLEQDLTTLSVTGATVEKPDAKDHPDALVVKGVPTDKSSDFRGVLNDKYSREYDFKSQPDGSWFVTMKASVVNDTKTRAVEQSIETIRNRVDQLGVSEPVIQQQGLGEDQIMVQLPGVDDPTRVKEIIQSTGMLEFRLVRNGPFATEQEATKGVPLPPDQMLMHGKTVTGQSQDQDQIYVVDRVAAVGGQDVRDARKGVDQNGKPDVDFYLTSEGGKRMLDFTRLNMHKPMAVVVEGKVREVATIEGEIGDSGLIHGRFSDDEANNLSMLLRSGALPANIKYLEERSVGPSLGADSIKQGVMSAIVGMGAVLIFMLVYYRGAGINANLALILNLVILLGCMGLSHAVLTLPGIAGVILTVGMGVDSNVLIFERIREELRAGKAPASAVDQGFNHAWITIVDTHVTTIVSAIILFVVGSGPVKGFAITLMFGLLANLFTAVFVSRVIFDAVLNRKA